MRMAAVPDRNNASCPRMLVAVAAASPDTISLPPTNKANVLVSVVINQQRPAVLALKSGEGSAIRSIITAVFILVSLYARNGARRPRASPAVLAIATGDGRRRPEAVRSEKWGKHDAVSRCDLPDLLDPLRSDAAAPLRERFEPPFERQRDALEQAPVRHSGCRERVEDVEQRRVALPAAGALPHAAPEHVRGAPPVVRRTEVLGISSIADERARAALVDLQRGGGEAGRADDDVGGSKERPQVGGRSRIDARSAERILLPA